MWFNYVLFILGTTIGAGILGLPIAYYNFGIWASVGIILAAIVTFCSSIVFVNVYKSSMIDVFDNTLLRSVAWISIFVSGFSALLAYTIGIMRLLNLSHWLGLLIVPLLLFFVNLYDLKREINVDTFFSYFLLIIILILIILLMLNANYNNLFNTNFIFNNFSFNKLHEFLKAVSISMFAFSGYFSLTEVYMSNKKDFKKILFTALLIVLLIYLSYTLLAISNGFKDLDFSNKAHSSIAFVAVLFGFFSMITSSVGVFVGLKVHLKLNESAKYLPILLYFVAFLVVYFGLRFEDLLSIGSKFGLSFFVGFLPFIYILIHHGFSTKVVVLSAFTSFIFFGLLIF